MIRRNQVSRSRMMNHQRHLEYEIRELEGRLQPHDTGHIHTTISVLKEREDNYKQQIKLVKPKWYDNKYLWYTYGIASAIIPIYLASQIPGL